MKRQFTSAVFLLCSLWTFAQFSGSGSGTENDPYLITNPTQLNQVRNFVGQSNVYFKMMADIDLTEFLEDEYPAQGWLPIGNSSSSFRGIFDGNGKTISGLWINRASSENVGLFGRMNGASIKNLTLKDVSIVGFSNVGAIAGKYDDGEPIINCNVSGNVIGGEKTGGIVGCTSSNIKDCMSFVTVKGTNYVGGIMGCSADLRIITAITNNIYIGDITGTNNVGGIAGFARAKTIEKCISLTNVSGTEDKIGGLAGSISLVDPEFGITNCVFSGSVVGRNQIGGLVGYNSGGYIKYCYSNGTVVGAATVGGLCGEINGSSSNRANCSSNVVLVSSIKSTNSNAGRVLGKIGSYTTVGTLGTTKENKVSNRAIVVEAGVVLDVLDDNVNGAGVSIATLKLRATYTAMGWDFTDTWAIQETECFPYLKTQTAPPVITSQVVSGATVISGNCVDGGTITIEIDGNKQQLVSSDNTFSFTVNPLLAGHEVRISAKADGKLQSYYTTATVEYIGKGTEAEPYQVYTASDLTGVYRKGYFKLMNDIDLTDYINQFSPTDGWQSIGRDGSETIHFDGDGHKITGLWCNSTRDNTGLFSCFANGDIKNLTVEVASGKQVKGGANTGIIIGKMINGTIENCKVVGAVADGTPVGGIIGLLNGGSISKSQANVTINTTAATSYVGGIVGEITSGTVDQCVTTGTLSATGATSYVGGLIGKNSATVTNCYSNAAITSSYNAAGIVAYNHGLVDMCYAMGNMYSNNYAAGVIGYNDGSNAIVRNCVAMNNKIEVTFESQQVQQGGGYGQRIIGGIKNNAPAPEMNNYALKTMQVSLNDIPQKVYDDIMNGTAKTDAELKQKAIYQELGWDFDNVWNIEEGSGYPYQTIIVSGESDPSNPINPDPSDPQTSVVVTDLSAIDNVIYIEPLESVKGSEITIPLLMKNAVGIRGFQFDLYLPEGVTVAKTGNGRFIATLSNDRKPNGSVHTLTVSEQPDGAIRFLCGSQYDETFTGSEGEVTTVKLVIAENVEDGQYPIILKNVKLTETNINNYYLTETVQTALTIISYTPGDISGDGVIDVSDYIGVANYILGTPQEGITAAAADVNKDNLVDVSDYIGVANLILYNNIYGQTANASRRWQKRANTDVSALNNVVYITPFETTSNSETQVSVKMKNTVGIRGFQFDLYLPDGITAKKDGNNRIVCSLNNGRKPSGDQHTLTMSEQPDGAIRFLCGSQYDETFTGNDGEIATLTISVAADVEADNYPIYLRNMKLTETDINNYYTTDEIETSVTVTGPADGRVVLDEASTTAPEAANGVDVRVKRTINANEWSTICLPFAMSVTQVKAAFGDDVQLGDFTSYDTVEDTGENVVGLTVNFNMLTAMEANHPYVIKVSNAISEFTADNVTIDPEEEPCVEYDNGLTGKKRVVWGSFTGTYVADCVIPYEGDDVSLFLSGNKWWYATAQTKHMKGYRAYFWFTDLLPDVSASRIQMAFNDETANVVELKDGRMEELKSYYNLKGQRVEKPLKKGLYIRNGKKVIIK